MFFQDCDLKPKKIFLIISLLIFHFGYSQKGQNNRWSIDLCAGGTNAVKPYTPKYWSNTVGFLHTSAGSRFMFNNKFGVKLDAGYDRIKNDESSVFSPNGNSLPFQSHYFRSSLQGVMDVGRLLTFENFTDKYSILFHAGGGMSVLTSKVNPVKDKMVNFMFGFTPQYKINNRVAVNLDASFIWHIYQQYTFDMHSPVYKRGFDGFIANATIGVSIYLGKHQEHHDWAYTPCYPDMSYLEVENKKLDSLNKKLNLSLMDDDDDGVINAMDDEKDTPLGNKVNCRGVSLKNIDSDGDGVSDLIDKCVDIPGDKEFEGCPKKIFNAIKDTSLFDSNTVVQVYHPEPIDTSNIAYNGGNGNNINGGNGNNTNGGNGNNTNGGNGNNTNGGNGNNTNGGKGNNTNGGNGNNTNGGNGNNTNGGNGNNTNGGNGNNTNGGNGNNTNGGNGNNTNGGHGNNTNVGNGNNTNGGNGNNTNGGNGNNTNGGNGNNTNGGNGNNTNGGNGNNTPKILNKEGFSSLADINFDLNQSTVNSKFNGLLNEVVSLLKDDPNTVLALEGHTDITGESSFNDKLSYTRANAIKKYLVSKGIDASRIEIGSFGESKPKFLNTTATGRALNRRVEIYIKK